ncbi:MAG: sensor histidine kinase [Negativicutes bacterium]|nr:sensor histidine kinase [Negativicutes bacterium]
MEYPLLIEMLERMSVIVTFAFVLSNTGMFRRLVAHQEALRDRMMLTAIFGLIGIVGTYAGIPIYDALANSRVVGVMAAGLVGGPLMGGAAGLIAGAHRYFLGGFTAFSCAVANLAEGLIAGIIHKTCPIRPIPWWVALAGGVGGETVQMIIILLTARPYEQAYRLVQEIALPMIAINSIGLAIFMLIMKTVQEAQERIGSERSQKALHIATKTLPYLRRGLTAETAVATAKIIYATGGYDAVGVTDAARVLAFIGAEEDHHSPDKVAGLTAATLHVLTTGQMFIAQDKADVGCSHAGCRLTSAVIVPLTQAGRTIGTLKLYYTRKDAVGPGDIIFANGLAHLFSTQLELTEIDRQAKLASRAELKALHAQINPHFFFNTLNTITSLVRTKPDQARELLIKLGTLFRFTMHNAGKKIAIADELTQVRAYLAIEQARHGNKLIVQEEIDEQALPCLIPSLTIQPLVENAIKHGLQPKESGGRIVLRVQDAGKAVRVSVTDDGIGMDIARVQPLQGFAGDGIGLKNVHERLQGLYGQGLNIESRPGGGTIVSFMLPKRAGDEVDELA